MNPRFKKRVWLLEVLAVLFIAYLFAKMGSTLLVVEFSSPAVSSKAKPLQSDSEAETGEEKEKKSAEGDYAGVVERDVFNSEDHADEEEISEEDSAEAETPTVPAGTPVQTALNISLISTFSVGNGQDARSHATITTKETGKEGDVFAVGGSFQSGTQITQVLPDRAIFSNQGRLEYVLLNDFVKGSKVASDGPPTAPAKEGEPAEKTEAGQGVESTGENRYSVSRAEIDKALENLPDLMKQIRVTPYKKDGQTSGLKLLSVRRDSIFAKLGLKRGDVLEKINGQTVDYTQGLELFNTLKSESKVTIDLLRRGEGLSLEYDLH